MATDYCLLTWAGKGITVTFTDVGDIVNWTNHGARTGQAFRFTTTGSLPTGLSAGTTYYLREGADANTFTIYPTLTDAQNGTNQVTFTGTGAGTNQVVGEYWASRTTEQKTRWGIAGSERVYGTMAASATGINALTSDFTKDIVVEVYDKYLDKSNTSNFAYKWRSMTFHSKVAGVRTPAFHGGVINGGYVFESTGTTAHNSQMSGARITVDGLQYKNNGTGVYSAVYFVGPDSVMKNCIITAPQGQYDISGNTVYYFNNIFYNCLTYGFRGTNYKGWASILAFNIAIGCGTGFEALNSYYSCVGNISVGNTTNWGGAPTGGIQSNNIGESTDTPWGTNALTTGNTAMFADYANGNFYPASGTAVQVGTITFADGDGLPRFDIKDLFRPDYVTSTFPTNYGTAGAFEYDHGDGNIPPSTVPITIDGMANGSVIAIYKSSDMSVILSPTTTTGTYSGSYTYTVDTAITVRVRKGTAATKYLPYEYQGTITSTGFALTVSQIPDPIA